MIDSLLLLSGNDIPFSIAQLTIHQPSLKEIAYIGEERFWFACELLKFNKENLTSEDKSGLSNMSNFNIIMTMLQDKTIEAQKAKINVLSLLTLLFPTKKVHLGRKTIQMRDNKTDEVNEITEDNFESFKEILIEIFCLSENGKEYDPSGGLAKKIADQLKRGREKRAKLASSDQSFAILSRYISILAVGESKNINDLMGYTVYQLMDEIDRFKLKKNWDSFIQFKCAGATDLKEPEDWFKDIHNDKEK